MAKQIIYETQPHISEGEIYIQEFFEEEGITAEFNKKISALKGDTKTCRYADFYLPMYDLYVEFQGKWNSGEEYRDAYREKRRVYYENNIACIEFYPDNLGWLKYLFYYRAMKELKDKGKARHLFKLRFDILRSRNPQTSNRIIISLLVLLITFIGWDIEPQFNLVIICLCSFVIFLESGLFYWEYRKLVKKKFHNV